MRDQVYLAAEDALGLAFGRRLLREWPVLHVCREKDGQGFGNLRRDASKYCRMAQNGVPVLLITDLDLFACPRAMVEAWLGPGWCPIPGFMLRICVREVEAWLLADPGPLARLFGLGHDQFPTRPELLPDPKAVLLRLAGRAPAGARRRQQLLPARGSKSPIGIGCNPVLVRVVDQELNLDVAASAAPSLGRARHRLGELARAVSPHRT